MDQSTLDSLALAIDALQYANEQGSLPVRKRDVENLRRLLNQVRSGAPTPASVTVIDSPVVAPLAQQQVIAPREYQAPTGRRWML